MSTLELQKATVSIPDASESPRGWRDLTVYGEQTLGAESFIKTVGNAVAPHYLVLMQRREQEVRQNPGDFKVHSDEEIRAFLLEDLEDHVKEEVKYLKAQHTDYEGSKLPSANDKAIRKVSGVWKMGGWLNDMVSVAECEKFYREKRKEMKDRLDKRTGQGTETTDVSMDDFGFADAETKEALAQALRELEKAYKANPGTTRDAVKKFRRTVDNIAHSSANAASKQATAA